MSEAEKVALMVQIFGWEDTREMRFNALYILRRARLEEAPSWDSFRLT